MAEVRAGVVGLTATVLLATVRRHIPLRHLTLSPVPAKAAVKARAVAKVREVALPVAPRADMSRSPASHSMSHTMVISTASTASLAGHVACLTAPSCTTVTL